MARESGWVVAEVTAGSGMLEDVEMRTRKGAAHLVEAPSKARVASIGIPNLMSIELDGRADESGNWRLRMERLLDQIEAAETGLLVTVDEVDGSLEDMVMLASVYQHFVRKDRRAGLLMAGLPHNVSVLLNDKTVSFLRRAHLEPLSRISDAEVSAAIEKTMADGGFHLPGGTVSPTPDRGGRYRGEASRRGGLRPAVFQGIPALPALTAFRLRRMRGGPRMK